MCRRDNFEKWDEIVFRWMGILRNGDTTVHIILCFKEASEELWGALIVQFQPFFKLSSSENKKSCLNKSKLLLLLFVCFVAECIFLMTKLGPKKNNKIPFRPFFGWSGLFKINSGLGLSCYREEGVSRIDSIRPELSVCLLLPHSPGQQLRTAVVHFRPRSYIFVAN